jgi:SAM-dependent methyltransferase
MTRSAQTQGALWSADPGAYADRAERRLQPLYEHALDRIGLPEGASLLDAGCATGSLVALATGRGLRATGLDVAAGLVAYARRRVAGAEFVVGELEALPFDDAAFDGVTALNALPYAGDPRRAIAELARVTRPGGRMLVTVGAGTEQDSRAARIHALAPPEEVPTWDDLDLRDPMVLHAAMRDAGLEVVDDGELRVDVVYADLEAAIAAQLPAGPVQAAVRHSGQAAVEEALRAAFTPLRRPDGTIGTVLGFRVTVGRRP